MADPTFSIIVPTFDRATFLHEALESVRAQSFDDFECIVVDDSSPEPVLLPELDGRFRMVRTERTTGPASARNLGLAEASGRYVAFLDDDDRFRPERLEIAVDGLRRSPISLCGMGVMGSALTSLPTLGGDVSDRILDSITPPLGATAVLRSACIQFDERYQAVEDVDWWVRMAATLEVAPVPRVGWEWRRHSGPRVIHGTLARIEGSLLLLEVHRDYFTAHPRAEAFRWLRIGQLASRVDDRALVRRAARRASRLDPRVQTLARSARLLAGR